MGRIFKALVAPLLLLQFVAVAVGSSPPATALSPNVVISQVYGGGGNAGATYTHDFVELFNRGTTSVSLAGWSVQYTSATGTGNFGANSGQLTELPAVTLAPGQFLLVQEATNAAVGAALPTPDVTDATPINMSGTAGKVALVSTTASLGCNGGSTPCSAGQLAQIIDLIGYGNANFFEGAGAAPTLSNTTAALRNGNGCIETDNNAADFAAAGPQPRNTSSTLNRCDVADIAINDVSANEGDLGTTSFVFTVSLSAPAGPGGVTFDIATADDTATATSGDYVAKSLTSQTIAETQSTYTFSVDVNGDTALEADDTFFVNITNVTGADNLDGRGVGRIVNDDVAEVAIHDIQGAAHLSPFVGQRVRTTPAVVTAVRRGTSTLGYYIQDVAPDGNVATSEGLFVFTDTTPPSVAVGQLVQVTGTVTEFGSSPNLTLTELSSPTVTVLSSGNALPAAVVIGPGGRVPPTTVIDDDSATRINVNTAGTFDATADGIDFYESLEGMYVQVNDVEASGPTSDFGSNREIPVVGAGSGLRTPRGGILVQPGDFNPERVFLNDWILGGAILPSVHVGTDIAGATVGVMDYSFGNFKLQVTSLGAVGPSSLTREVANAPDPGELAVASFNVENLTFTDPAAKFETLADLIVNNLHAPDLIAIEEIQDNNGTAGGIVDASQTYARLIEAIDAEGDVTYEYRQIDPVNGADGGAPGGNIRQAFLYRTDRGLSFVDRPGATSTTAVGVVSGATGPELTFSPGRIEPANAAFNASRKPLAGEFQYQGRTLFVVANHFNSKGGDEPLFGRFQPPDLVTEDQRIAQAALVADFTNDVRAIDDDAAVIVLGDINDFHFSAPMAELKAAGLTPLIETLAPAEQYGYVFQGNSQALDHILVSPSLFARPLEYDSVHVNSEFADQASDHDPQLVLLQLNAAPTVDAGGPYAGVEGTSVTVSATGSDTDGDALTYAWDLDNNGTFETPGQTVTVTAPAAPTSITIAVRATDPGGLTATDTATVQGQWNWSGFFDPISNLPTLNVVRAGQSVPVQFSLDGDQGLDVFAEGYPKVSGPVPCTSTSGGGGTETDSANRSGLQYDAATDEYTYVWKTKGNWTDTCRFLTVTLADGTTHQALFQFTR